MWYEVAMMGALIASFIAVGAVGAAARRGDRARASAAPVSAGPATGSSDSSTAAGADAGIEPSDLEEKSRSALVACVFAAEPADHLCWTAMVVDPALHDTPSHIRLVGQYGTELAAMDAAYQLADALNECLVPGEAPLTATALGIEPAPEPDEGRGPGRHTATRRAIGPDPLDQPLHHEPLNHEPLHHEPLNHEPLHHEPLNHEPLSLEPLSRTGRPIAYSGTPLAGHGALTDLDDAAFNHR